MQQVCTKQNPLQMAYVEIYTNFQLDKLEEVVKQIVSEGTGKQEMTILSKLCPMKVMCFGGFKSAMLINIRSVAPDDEYREKKLLSYIVNKLYYKYGISKQQIYVTYTTCQKDDINVFNKV